VPLAVAKRDRPATEAVEAFERFDEVAVERIAPHLAVGQDAEARRFLERQRFVHRAILDPFELARAELPALVTFPGLLEKWRPQQAADDICPGPDHEAIAAPRPQDDPRNVAYATSKPGKLHAKHCIRCRS